MIRYIKPVTQRAADGLVAGVYGQIKREFGVLGEPLTLHSPLPDVLAGVWCSLRETILTGAVPRTWKESVAVAVSKLNECSYCVDAHTVMLRAMDAHEAAGAIQYGRSARMGDATLLNLVEWAKATRTPGSAVLAQPPFRRAEAAEVIGTAIWIHYINRISLFFIGGGLLPITSNKLGLRSLAERMGGLYFSGTVRRRLAQGESLGLAGDFPLPAEFGWAAASTAIARAFAGFASAIETAGAAALAPAVRACIESRLERWDGGDPGLGRSWMNEPLGELSSGEVDEGRLALLAAFAPNRIDDDTVRSFRDRKPADAELVAAVAWSVFAVVRRISRWVGGG